MLLLVLAISCGVSLLVCAILVKIVIVPTTTDFTGASQDDLVDGDEAEDESLLSQNKKIDPTIMAEITGVELLKSTDFHFLFSVVALCLYTRILRAN